MCVCRMRWSQSSWRTFWPRRQRRRRSCGCWCGDWSANARDIRKESGPDEPSSPGCVRRDVRRIEMSTPVQQTPAQVRASIPPFLKSSISRWAVVLFAMAYPSFLSWLDFVALVKHDAGPNPAQTIAYGAGKVFQFVFPVVCLWLFERQRPHLARPSFRGVEIGLGFGLLVAGGMIGLYYGWFRQLPAFAELATIVQRKLGEFGIASPVRFWLFAVVLSILHSLLEEYYWRWFVFGWLRGDPASGRPGLVAVPTAIAVSGFAF